MARPRVERFFDVAGYLHADRAGKTREQVNRRAEAGRARHGTQSEYTNWGCRCPECTAAWAVNRAEHPEYQDQYRTRPIPSSVHGTTSGAFTWRCKCNRCEPIRAAMQRTWDIRKRTIAIANAHREIIERSQESS